MKKTRELGLHINFVVVTSFQSLKVLAQKRGCAVIIFVMIGHVTGFSCVINLLLRNGKSINDSILIVVSC